MTKPWWCHMLNLVWDQILCVVTEGQWIFHTPCNRDIDQKLLFSLCSLSVSTTLRSLFSEGYGICNSPRRSHKKIHHNQSNSSQIQHIVPSYSIHGWKWQVAGSLSNLPREEIGFGTVDQTWSQGLAPKCLPCRVGGFWSVISVLGNECYPWISTEKLYKRLIKWVYEYRGKWDKDSQLWRFRVSQSSMSISYFERV